MLAQVGVLLGSFAFSTWDGNRVLDSSAARWWIAIAGVIGVAFAILVMQGHLWTLALLGLLELWPLSLGAASDLSAVARLAFVAPALAVIVMCAFAARTAERPKA